MSTHLVVDILLAFIASDDKQREHVIISYSNEAFLLAHILGPFQLDLMILESNSFQI